MLSERSNITSPFVNNIIIRELNIAKAQQKFQLWSTLGSNTNNWHNQKEFFPEFLPQRCFWLICMCNRGLYRQLCFERVGFTPTKPSGKALWSLSPRLNDQIIRVATGNWFHIIITSGTKRINFETILPLLCVLSRLVWYILEGGTSPCPCVGRMLLTKLA